MTEPAAKTAPVEAGRRGSEYLANERTFLAWIRTAIAVISLGFLISRFSLWLQELSVSMGSRVGPPRPETSLKLGELMIGFGAVLAILAAWRYHTVNRDIEKGTVTADRGLILLVTMAVFLVATAMILYVFARH